MGALAIDSGVTRSPEKPLASGQRIVLWTTFVYAFLVNAWVADDAFITFRTVWNFNHGYGLTWNVAERAQVYTHPLWMFLVSLGFALTREPFYTSLALSLGLCLGTLYVVQRSLGAERQWQVTPFLLLLLSSKAFFDYTSSGLENPLSYFLIALFYGPFLFRAKPASEFGARDVLYYFALASLAFFNRIDTVILFVPVLPYVLFATRKLPRATVARAALLGVTPALLWLAFATVYYGFPFPNTYYAKAGATGTSTVSHLRQGVAYFLNSLAWDPPTLCTVVATIVVAARHGSSRARLAATGAALYLVYILCVGASGTHMSGRFFSLPYLVSVMVVLSLPLRRRSFRGLGALALLLILACPMSPLKAATGYYSAGGANHDGWARNGIIDIRHIVYVHDGSVLVNFERETAMPNMPWYDDGLKFKAGRQKVRVGGAGAAIGFFGYAAGPDKFIIDTFALGDPLLSHLPIAFGHEESWGPGHFEREVPPGYEASVREQKNLIVDPDLHAYYDKIWNVTRGPIWTAQRFRDIWALNSGAADHLVKAYAARRGTRPR